MKKYKTDERCIACGRVQENGNVLHHVQSRGAGGCDEYWNLMPLTNDCHNEVHMKGLNEFSEKYIYVKTWLYNNGWRKYGGKYRRLKHIDMN
jgi:5-methylcytosine-specific restriction endonuclease McrA